MFLYSLIQLINIKYLLYARQYSRYLWYKDEYAIVPAFMEATL